MTKTAAQVKAVRTHRATLRVALILHTDTHTKHKLQPTTTTALVAASTSQDPLRYPDLATPPPPKGSVSQPVAPQWWSRLLPSWAPASGSGQR